jgi:hypothetical protein
VQGSDEILREGSSPMREQIRTFPTPTVPAPTLGGFTPSPFAPHPPASRRILRLRAVPSGTVLNSRTSAQQKYGAAPRKARI